MYRVILVKNYTLDIMKNILNLLIFVSILVFFHSCTTVYNDAVISINSEGTKINTPEMEYKKRFNPEKLPLADIKTLDDAIKSIQSNN